MDVEVPMIDSVSRSRRTLGRLGAATLAGSAILAGVACTQQPAAQTIPAPVVQAPVAQAASAANALPVAVNCGVGQQALIRPAFINGQAISQVDCVATGVPMAPAMAGPGPAPASWPVAAARADDVETVRIVERPAYRQTARPVSYRTAEYAPRRVVKSGRSWQKSALIIGSSAGIAAGVGGEVGGKKGALIGAAVGGGGATIWDQVTRRR
jgi:hypothetical protein